MNLLALFGISMEPYYDRSHSFYKNIILMVFLTYKYLHVQGPLWLIFCSGQGMSQIKKTWAKWELSGPNENCLGQMR